MATPFQELQARLRKPARGQGILDREAARARAVAEERQAIADAKRRDGYRCRWPEAHICRGWLEGAHVVNKSLGGHNVAANILPLCRWIHRAGPESIHGQQLRVEIEDPRRGTAGPVSFWRQTAEFDELGQPIYACVARERAPFVLERD